MSVVDIHAELVTAAKLDKPRLISHTVLVPLPGAEHFAVGPAQDASRRCGVDLRFAGHVVPDFYLKANVFGDGSVHDGIPVPLLPKCSGPVARLVA